MNTSPHNSQVRRLQDRTPPQFTNMPPRQAVDVDLQHSVTSPVERDDSPLVFPFPRGTAMATRLRLQLPADAIGLSRAEVSWIAHRSEVDQALSISGRGINMQASDGTSILMLNVVQSPLSATQTLLAYPGINVNLRNSQGNTALHLAAQAGRVEQLDALLDDGRVDTCLINAHGRTALCLAAQYDRAEVVKHLLNRRPQNGNTQHQPVHEDFKAYRLALGHNAFNVVSVLLDTIPGLRNATGSNGHTALTVAIKAGRLDLVQKLLAQYPDLNVDLVGEGLGTALNVAAEQRNVEMVLTLLRYPELDPNGPVDHLGSTVLHRVASRGDANIVQALMSAQPFINVSAVTQSLDTPLHCAAYSGDVATVRVLAIRVDDVNQRDQSGQSALHFAACSGNLETVRFLLQLPNVDPLAVSDIGQYPSDITNQFGHTDVSRVLRDAELAAFRSSTNP
jgi:ankyrin repeat protein